MYSRILVAVDGSELSHNALDYAVNLAEKFGSELKIVTVVPRPIYYISMPMGIYSDVVVFNDSSTNETRYTKYLAKAEAKVRSDYPDLDVRAILMEGRPSVKIVELAEKEGCDIIIMGCRGLSGIIGLLEESTSRSVMNKSKIPVMIIK